MRARLFVVFLVPLTCILLVLGGAYAWSASRSIQQEFTHQQLTDLSYFATNARQALRASNPGIVESEIERYAELYDSEVAVLDRTGAVWVSGGMRGTTLTEEASAQVTLALSGRRSETPLTLLPWTAGEAVVVEPVFDDGNVIGAVMISAAADAPRGQILSQWIGLIAAALGKTLAAFGAAAVMSLVLGFLLAIGRLSNHAVVRIPATTITEVFRAVPVLVMMMLLYYGLPSVGVDMDPYWAVVIALVVYNGSVLAEVLRAGIEAIPKGQSEAGYAIGLRKSGVMRLILLPQAVRSMLPVIIAQLVVTMKDTALGFIITYPELLYLAKQLSSNVQFGCPLLQSAFVIGGIYIIMCLILSFIANLTEKRLRSSSKGIDNDGAVGSMVVGGAVGGTVVIPEVPGAAGGTDTEIIGVQGIEDEK